MDITKESTATCNNELCPETNIGKPVPANLLLFDGEPVHCGQCGVPCLVVQN